MNKANKKSRAQKTRGDARWERRPGQCKFRKSVTVTTATTATATAAATAAAAAVTAATAVFTAGRTIATGTFFLRTGDVDRQGAFAEAGAVHGFNRLLGFFGGG